MVLGHTARKRLSWAGSWDLGLFRLGSDHWALRPPRRAPGRVFWEEACGRAKEAGRGAGGGGNSRPGFCHWLPSLLLTPAAAGEPEAGGTNCCCLLPSAPAGSGWASGPRLDRPLLSQWGAGPPPSPSPGPGDPRGWGAQCLGCPLTSPSPAVTRVVGTAHTIHVAVSSQPAPTRQRDPAALPLWAFCPQGPAPEKVSYCPRNSYPCFPGCDLTQSSSVRSTGGRGPLQLPSWWQRPAAAESSEPSVSAVTPFARPPGGSADPSPRYSHTEGPPNKSRACTGRPLCTGH